MAVKKKWYDIVAPECFGGKVISQTLAADPKHLVDRIIKISYADISQDFNKFFIKLHFRVTNVDETKCNTELVAHSIQNDRVYRMIRRRARKVGVIQEITTKDNKKVRIKTILILPNRVNTSLRARVRAKAKELIEKKAKTANFIDLVKLLILGGFVMDVKKQCSKIYPVSQIEFYKSELLPVVEEEKSKEKPEPVKEIKPKEKKVEKPTEVESKVKKTK